MSEYICGVHVWQYKVAPEAVLQNAEESLMRMSMCMHKCVREWPCGRGSPSSWMDGCELAYIMWLACGVRHVGMGVCLGCKLQCVAYIPSHACLHARLSFVPGAFYKSMPEGQSTL